MSALDKQVDGDHYKTQKIQPVEYIHANNLDFFEGNVVKYVTRWRNKNGLADLEKAKHYIELLIQLEQTDKPSCFDRQLGCEACSSNCPVKDECYKGDDNAK